MYVVGLGNITILSYVHTYIVIRTCLSITIIKNFQYRNIDSTILSPIVRFIYRFHNIRKTYVCTYVRMFTILVLTYVCITIISVSYINDILIISIIMICNYSHNIL